MKSNVAPQSVLISILLVLFLIAGCEKNMIGPAPPSVDLLRITIQQGIAGRVWFWKGDFMPFASGTITPVVRHVLIFTPTHFDSVYQVDYSPFYRHIFTKLISITVSNDSGFFQVSLDPGRYSIFVKEGSLYYSNCSDGSGYIQPVTIVRDSVTQINFDITYKATF